MGLLSNKVNEGYLRMLGPLFTWKFLLMVSILVACVFMFRFFCRFLCPLGALYGLFNKISLVGVKVDHAGCTDCGLCIGKCEMDVRHVGDTECISCGECINACPTKAISWKGSKLFLAPNAIDGAESNVSSTENTQKISRRNRAVKIVVGFLMAAALCGALVYYNFIDGRENESPAPPVDSTDVTVGNETADPDQPQKPPVGTAVGNTCPAISLDIVGSGEKFDIQESAAGRVVVLNFWFTTCGPCLEELPYFYRVATDYADQVSVVAVHIEQPNVNVTDFISNASGHPEWNDGTMLIGWDTDKYCQRLFQIQACPITVVINADGVITDKFIGGLKHSELVAAVDKALGK